MCRGINCKHGAHCEQGLCICPTDCPSTEETLCATDMNTVSTLSIIHVHNRTQSEVDQSSLKDTLWYSIVKESSADLGVNFKIVQIRPTVKAVCTKISKNFFCIFVNIFIFLRENKEVSFFIF